MTHLEIADMLDKRALHHDLRREALVSAGCLPFASAEQAKAEALADAARDLRASWSEETKAGQLPLTGATA